MWRPQGIYSDYILNQPTILFNDKAVYGLSSYPCARVAVITGKSINDNLKSMLCETFKKKSLQFFSRSWEGEPYIEGLVGCIAELEKFRPDLIIAVGGGGIIDGAKLCRLFYEFPYFKIGETRLSQLYFKSNFIAIPTTIGSGAEASSAAVYINKGENRKDVIVCHELQPSVVVLNPEYVKSAPEKLIVTSSLDAVSHIIEGYISKKENELIDIYAEKALSIFYNELQSSARDYQKMQFAGYLGGIVQNHCLVGGAHAIAHQLSQYGYAHSEAIALILPSVIKVNGKDDTNQKKLERLCSCAGINGIDNLLEFLNTKIKDINFSDKRAELCSLLTKLLDNEQFVYNVISDVGGSGNTIPITKEYIKLIIEDLKNEL